MDTVVDKHNVLAAVHKVQNGLCGVTEKLEKQNVCVESHIDPSRSAEESTGLLKATGRRLASSHLSLDER